jgi:hypothetical protein
VEGAGEWALLVGAQAVVDNTALLDGTWQLVSPSSGLNVYVYVAARLHHVASGCVDVENCPQWLSGNVFRWAPHRTVMPQPPRIDVVKQE